MRRSLLDSTPVALAVSCVLATVLLAQQKPTFRSGVDIVVVDAHVVDESGLPVRGLAAEDFQVRIDGRPAHIANTRWIVAEPSTASAPSVNGAPSPAPAVPTSAPEAASSRAVALPSSHGEASGRLIVFVFQRSMEPSRQIGMVKMQRSAERFINSLSSDDRIAVALFDSHLKLACDFTADRGRLIAAVRQATVWTTPAQLQSGPFPSLAAVFDYRAASLAGSIEQALTVLGGALRDFPGPKPVILFGWGFGQLSGSVGLSGSNRVLRLEQHIAFDEDYSKAREALLRSRASVFSVDVTDAATHSLEAGLQVLSEDTGGFYVRTVEFAETAFDKVARILSARYELSVDKPDLPRGKHTIEIRVPHRNVTVFARKSYSD